MPKDYHYLSKRRINQLIKSKLSDEYSNKINNDKDHNIQNSSLIPHISNNCDAEVSIVHNLPLIKYNSFTDESITIIESDLINDRSDDDLTF